MQNEELGASSKAKNKNRFYFVGLVVLFLIVFVVLYVFFIGKQDNKQENKEISNMQKNLLEKGIIWARLTPLQQANYLSDAGDYQAAELIWQNNLSSAGSLLAKSNIYFRQASLAVQFKKEADAIKYTKELVKTNPNYQYTYVAQAQLATLQNKNAIAIKYWQKAIKRINPNFPGANLTRLSYESYIGKLKAEK